MSHVTDTFLLTSVMFDPQHGNRDSETLTKIIDWIKDDTNQELKRLDTNHSAYGGSKVMQASVWCGAFNYLDIQGFIEFLRTLNWNDADSVQLLYQDEQDDGFTLVNILEVKDAK